MKTRRYTTYEWETPDGSMLEVPWEFCEDSELFKVSDDGRSCVLGTLTQDVDAQNPVEEWDNGELVIFGNNREQRPDIETFKRLVREHPGHIVPVDYSGGSYTWIRCGNLLTAADCRGDKRTGDNSHAEQVLDDMDGYYIIPEDATSPQSYADGNMETLQQYYDGDVYGVCVWSYTRDFAAYDLHGVEVPGEYTDWSEACRDQECWGFFGSDYAEQELKEQFDSTAFPVPEDCTDVKQGTLPGV